jgi:hypothetical protein
MTTNVIQHVMIGYDIYRFTDRFTMEHFPLRQSMILTTSFFSSRQYKISLLLENTFNTYVLERTFFLLYLNRNLCF